ncbi:hypothetical protein DL770_002454 [Monosporascus sp. CRB-9-2]|nr:hypothetical protein DL770_002454 [Monosporascus sp. CRB-9-2]
MKAFAKLSNETVEKKRDTYLGWKHFDFKLSEKNRLRGSDNWEMWKTASWVALLAIGYHDGDSVKLTRTDEAQLAAAVIANVKEGPMAVVAGLTKGIEMFKTLERSYGAKGIDRQMDVFSQLQFLRWDPKKTSAALDHVVVFKYLVYDDFVAEFRGKESKGKKPEGQSHNAKKLVSRPAIRRDGVRLIAAVRPESSRRLRKHHWFQLSLNLHDVTAYIYASPGVSVGLAISFEETNIGSAGVNLVIHRCPMTAGMFLTTKMGRKRRTIDSSHTKNGCGVPERFWSDMNQFSEFEEHIKSIVDKALVPAGDDVNEALAGCFVKFRAARQSVENNGPAVYTPAAPIIRPFARVSQLPSSRKR